MPVKRARINLCIMWLHSHEYEDGETEAERDEDDTRRRISVRRN